MWRFLNFIIKHEDLHVIYTFEPGPKAPHYLGSFIPNIVPCISGGKTGDKSEADTEWLPYQAHSENNKIPVTPQGKKPEA